MSKHTDLYSTDICSLKTHMFIGVSQTRPFVFVQATEDQRSLAIQKPLARYHCLLEPHIVNLLVIHGNLDKTF